MVRAIVPTLIAIASSGCLAGAGGPDPDAVGQAGELPFADGTADAFRALRVANTLSAVSLQRNAKLTTTAARNIVARRAGADGIDGTADDRPFYTLAELDAVRDVGPAMIGRLATYGGAHSEVLGASLHVDALPPELAGDPNTAGMLTAMAADPSLMIDDDATTLLAGEWELSALFAHHFNETTAARVARVRSYVFGSDVRSGPFLDIVTIDRVNFGEGAPSFALGALLRRTAVDPRHTVGRIYAPELEAALADDDSCMLT